MDPQKQLAEMIENARIAEGDAIVKVKAERDKALELAKGLVRMLETYKDRDYTFGYADEPWNDLVYAMATLRKASLDRLLATEKKCNLLEME